MPGTRRYAVAGLTFTVTGLTEWGVSSLPSTVSLTPDGLPSWMLTRCPSRHVIDLPALTVPRYSCLPLLLEIATQQFLVAVSLITASPAGYVAVIVAFWVGLAEGDAVTVGLMSAVWRAGGFGELAEASR